VIDNIRVYASKFDATPHETFSGGDCTIGEWLHANIKAYNPEWQPLFSISLNGENMPPEQWPTRKFGTSDHLDFFIEPKGIELLFAVIIAVVAAVAAIALAPKAPKPSSAESATGNDLNEATVKGNKVKVNTPIEDQAGYHKSYPSYLSPPREYFNGPRDQRVDLILCCGAGELEFEEDKILIGDTPLISLGADAEYTIYPPGADVSADPRSWWWHDVGEVGASSSGSAGLELTESTTLTNGFQASSIQYNVKTVAIPTGSGLFPEDWSVGLLVRIDNPYVYEFIDGGSGVADIIRGDNLSMLKPVVGQLIEISGVNAGFYKVASYTPGTPATTTPPAPATPPQITLEFDDGTPVTELSLGTIATTIGTRFLRYRITAFTTSQISVDRLTASGATDTTWPGFNFLQTANSVIVLDRTTREGGYRGPFAMCPEGEKTQTLEFTVFCPKGLVGLGREGQQYAVFGFYQFEYRDLDVSGDWTVLNFQNEGSSLDAVGFTNRVQLPYPMRPEARIKKVYTQQVERENEVNNDMVWYAAKALLPGASSYPGATTMCLTVRGGDRLSAASERQVSMQGTRVLPVRRDGTWQPPEPTRSIAAYALYLLKAVGYSDDDLDLEEWDRLNDVWEARGDYYDAVHSTPSTIKSLLDDCLAAGFAELTVVRGRIRPVRDEPQTQFMSLYTPGAMTGPLQIQFEAVRPDDYDGVDVEFTSSRTWAVESVSCRLPGDEGVRTQKIQAVGITNRDKAYQLGMRQRRALKYRRKTFNWSTEMAAFNSNYLDYVQVAGDVPGYAQSAYMYGYDAANSIVTAGEEFDWSVGTAPFYLTVRRHNGSSSGPYTVTRINEFMLQLDRPLDFTPVLDGSMIEPLLLFGRGWPVQLTEISPNGLETCTVEARIYDDRVYLSDNDPAPAE